MATSQVNAMVQARANQGLMTNVRNGEGNAGILNFAAGLHANGASRASRGLGAYRATGKVMGQGLGAAQSFGQMFSGMSKAAIWGKAFANSDGTIMSAMEQMERIGETPGGVIDANKDISDEWARLSQLGAGLSSGQAKDVVNYKNKAVSGYGGPGLAAISQALPLTKAKANASARRVSMVDIKQSEELINIMSNIEATLMQFASGDGIGMKIVRGIDDLIALAKRWFP